MLFKNIFISAILIATFYQVNFGQSKPINTNLISSTKIHLNVYRNGIKSGDYTAAIIALNYLVTIEEKTGKYRDSLAYLYFLANNFYQSLYWSNQVLVTEPNNVGLLEIKASSLRQTNQLLLSIETYEYLLKKSPSPIYAINLTELQYQVKRLYECVATTKLAETMVIPKDMLYTYKLSEQQLAKTPLLAAVYNYKGLALYELGNKVSAKEAFEKALTIDTSFFLAKSNLLVVIKELIPTQKLPSSQPSPANENIPAKEPMKKEKF
jgi:tetratricopeptide (TPR) repeat protein